MVNFTGKLMSTVILNKKLSTPACGRKSRCMNERKEKIQREQSKDIKTKQKSVEELE